MPVVYLMNKSSTTQKEPYVSFDKKFKMISEELFTHNIEIPLGGREGSFLNGFYNGDMSYCKNSVLRFQFSKVSSEQLELDGAKEGVFVRGCYSYECDSDTIDYQLNRLKALGMRGSYIYIPGATYMEFSYQIDSTSNLCMDAVTTDKDLVRQICFSMISHYIALLALDD